MKHLEKYLMAATLASSLAAPPSAMADEATVAVAGIDLGNSVAGTENESSLITMIPRKHTGLDLWIAVPGKIILGADAAAWQIDKFTDDKGTDFFAAPGHAPSVKERESSLRLYGNGKLGRVHIESPGVLPAADASRLSLRGTLVFRCGTTPITATQKNVAMKVGSQITAGPVPLTISAIKLSHPNDPNAGYDVTLQSKQPWGRISRIEFLNAAGASAGLSPSGEASNTSPGTYSQKFYTFGKVPPVLSVQVSSVATVETVSVPVHVETGVDLGG